MNVLKRGMKWAQQYCHSAAVSRPYLCLHHGHSVGPHVRHQAQYIHELVVTDVLQEPIQGYECPRPSHASAATHTQSHAPPKMHMCTCICPHHNHLCTCADTCRHIQKHVHTPAHTGVGTPRRDTCTEEGGHSWHSPSSAVGSGPWLQPRVPVPLACTPGTNSHATAALIPDFRPFICSLPRIRSDSRRQGHGMWLLLM